MLKCDINRDLIFSYVKHNVADPGSGAFLTPGSGIRDGSKYQDPDPG